MNIFSELFFSRSHQNKVDHSEYFNFSAQSLGPVGLVRKLWAFEITPKRTRKSDQKLVEYGVE